MKLCRTIYRYTRLISHFLVEKIRNGICKFHLPLGDDRVPARGSEDRGSEDVAVSLQRYLELAATIPGWLQGEDAKELMNLSYRLPNGAVIVELGSFFGRSAVLLAGPRRLRGSGKVHCIDPFDCSGDTYSMSHYFELLQTAGGGSLRNHFQANMKRTGLSSWVEMHQGRATEIAAKWTASIDLLLLDGDQSPAGARAAYESWIPFLNMGGVLVLRNSAPRQYAEGHDGHRLLALTETVQPRYYDIRQIGGSTFARKNPSSEKVLTITPGGMKLFTTIYDDFRLLPHFLAHYETVGVSCFYIAVSPGLQSAVAEFQTAYNIVVVDDVDVSETVSGGNSAVSEMRRRWQGSDEWVIIVDLDEFIEFPQPFAEILGRAGKEGANVVRGVMWDRLSGDGQPVGFDRNSDLAQVYPVRARLTQKLMLGADYKGVMVKGLLRGLVAHHIFDDEVIYSERLDISHYKWTDKVLERVRAARDMAADAGKKWAVEYERVLEHYQEHGRFAWEEFDGELLSPETKCMK